MGMYVCICIYVRDEIRFGEGCGTACRGCGSGGVYVVYTCMYVYVCVCMYVSVYTCMMNDVVERVVGRHAEGVEIGCGSEGVYVCMQVEACRFCIHICVCVCVRVR